MTNQIQESNIIWIWDLGSDWKLGFWILSLRDNISKNSRLGPGVF